MNNFKQLMEYRKQVSQVKKNRVNRADLTMELDQANVQLWIRFLGEMNYWAKLPKAKNKLQRKTNELAKLLEVEDMLVEMRAKYLVANPVQE